MTPTDVQRLLDPERELWGIRLAIGGFAFIFELNEAKALLAKLKASLGVEE